MTTTIYIPAGTTVGLETTADRVVPIELLGSVIVEANREPDGSWSYDVGRGRYYCAGGSATVHHWPESCSTCERIGDGLGPSHDGSPRCESGSLASGGKTAHCSCDTCF